MWPYVKKKSYIYKSISVESVFFNTDKDILYENNAYIHIKTKIKTTSKHIGNAAHNKEFNKHVNENFHEK